MENFWDNKPVSVDVLSSPKQILSRDELYDNTNKEIENSTIQLDYTVYCEQKTPNIIDYQSITEFINKHYLNNDIQSTIYTIDLIKFYSKDCLIIEFYPKGTKTIVGYVFGRKHKISIYNNIVNTLEVNFLCIIPKLRSINIATYIINIITRECVINYNIAIAEYTVNRKIKSPYFSEKYFYHNPINISKLYQLEFLDQRNNITLYIEKFNKFKYDINFKNSHTIQYINNGIDYFTKKTIDSNIIKELYEKLINYNKKTYDIFEYIDYEYYSDTFKYNDFHHFIIRNINNEITNYILIYKLECYKKIKKIKFTNGYFYNMFFNKTDDIQNSIALINEFIYNYMIFDLITIIDIFNFDYKLINFLLGNDVLRYYYFNMNMSPIYNYKNNLITL